MTAMTPTSPLPAGVLAACASILGAAYFTVKMSHCVATAACTSSLGTVARMR